MSPDCIADAPCDGRYGIPCLARAALVRLAVTILLVQLAGCGSAGSGSAAVQKPVGHAVGALRLPAEARIAFARLSGPLNIHREIWVMAGDGSRRNRVVGDPPGGSDPVWSPDGTQILFTSKHEGNAQVYVVNSDGTDVRRITRSAATDWACGWSPDGRQVLFTRRRGLSVAGPEEIWAASAQGTSQVRLADDAAGSLPPPAWSPDGKRIAYVAKQDDNDLIFIVNADGSGRHQLTHPTRRHAGQHDAAPAWAPDGRALAFSREGGGIWVMGADGSAQAPIRGTEPGDMFPVWSPDGGRIAFVGSGKTVGRPQYWASVGHEAELYVMDVGRDRRLRLTTNADEEYGPAWSPDGHFIAFTSARDGNREIYVMRSDGSGQTNLTNDPNADDQNPAWWAPRH